jgi:hypothetical protein
MPSSPGLATRELLFNQSSIADRTLEFRVWQIDQIARIFLLGEYAWAILLFLN